jgi:exoribonuclease II
MSCKQCYKETDELKYKLCLECVRLRNSNYQKRRDSVTRCFYNLQQHFRENKMNERLVWDKDDVRKLYDDWMNDESFAEVRENAERTGRPLRLRVVHVNPTKPFLPANAVMSVIGMKNKQ